MELNPAFSFDFGGEADAHQAPWEFGGERRCLGNGRLLGWTAELPLLCCDPVLSATRRQTACLNH